MLLAQNEPLVTAFCITICKLAKLFLHYYMNTNTAMIQITSTVILYLHTHKEKWCLKNISIPKLEPAYINTVITSILLIYSCCVSFELRLFQSTLLHTTKCFWFTPAYKNIHTLVSLRNNMYNYKVYEAYRAIYILLIQAQEAEYQDLWRDKILNM